MPGGETDLRAILHSLNPQLRDPTYVFMSIPVDQFASAFTKLTPISTIFEEEGLSLIVTKEAAATWHQYRKEQGILEFISQHWDHQ